jgi:CDP-paratose 2-epimerase
MTTHVLIIGGAGFIGSNAAHHFASRGARVTILDNFSRKGTEQNVAWVQGMHKDVAIIRADVTKDQRALDTAAAGADLVLHLAGQVAVTTSVQDPRSDFMANALGTFNVLEAVRASQRRPFVVYSSTNKVYGGMEDAAVVERNGRYEYRDDPEGLDERTPLDFHSPYGCSKGAADQYVRDYHRIYGLDTVVFRQSCIYGTRQFGIEDQGWLAWFTIAAMLGKPITIFGDGKQVRDVLFVEDLCALYEAAFAQREKSSGEVYNVGGGPKNTLSLRELLGILERELGKKIPVKHGPERPGDQKVFVANIRKAHRELGWEPKVGVDDGVRRLVRWIKENPQLFRDV